MNVFSEKKGACNLPKDFRVFSNKEFKNKIKMGRLIKNDSNWQFSFDNNNHTILQLTNYISLK